MICKESDLRYILNRVYHGEVYPEDAMDSILGRFNKPTDLSRLPVRISFRRLPGPMHHRRATISFGLVDRYETKAETVAFLLQDFRQNR